MPCDEEVRVLDEGLVFVDDKLFEPFDGNGGVGEFGAVDGGWVKVQPVQSVRKWRLASGVLVWSRVMAPTVWAWMVLVVWSKVWM